MNGYLSSTTTIHLLRRQSERNWKQLILEVAAAVLAGPKLPFLVRYAGVKFCWSCEK